MYYLKLIGISVTMFLLGCVKTESVTEDFNKPEALVFSSSKNISTENIQEYLFQGSCLEEGVDNIDYLLTGYAEEGIEGTISCENGEWSLDVPKEELSSFEDGEMYLTINTEKYSTSITIEKDLQPPVLKGLSQNSRGKWIWECDLAYPCSEYRVVFNNKAQYEFTDDISFLDQLESRFPEDISANGTKDFYVHVQARDLVGNLSNILSSDAFLVDNAGPIIEDLQEEEGGWSWGCSEENCEYRFVVNDSPIPPMVMDGGFGPHTSVSPATGPGTYYAHIQSRDSFGNKSAIVSSIEGIVVSDPDIKQPEAMGITAYGKNYGWGEEIVLTVDFQEAVMVIGDPVLSINIGDGTGEAFFSGQTGVSAKSHQFIYTVQGYHNGNLVVTGLVDGENSDIQDSAGNPIDREFPRQITVEGVFIDTTLPIVEGLENDMAPKRKKVWQWNCSEENCIYRMAINDQGDFSFSNEPYRVDEFYCSRLW